MTDTDRHLTDDFNAWLRLREGPRGPLPATMKATALAQSSFDEIGLHAHGCAQATIDALCEDATARGFHCAHYKYPNHEILHICTQDVLKRRMFELWRESCLESERGER